MIRDKLAELFKKKKLPDNFKNFNKSFSQSGEDLILKFAFWCLKIERPTYLDIGAHHAFYLSNTALFYEQGSRGVLVEPDPQLFSEIVKLRTGDLCLNVGIGTGNEEDADFYVMTSRTLNTFSKEEAQRYAQNGQQKIEAIIKIPLVNVNKIIKNNFNGSPNLVSLDTEGFDLAILKSFDFSNYRPEIFCVETITYTEDNTEEKINTIIDFMKSVGYMVYADTYINTIFVDAVSWKKR